MLEQGSHETPVNRVQVSDAFSGFPSLPRVMSTSATEDLPGKPELQVQSIKFSLHKHRNKDHTTPLRTRTVDGSGEHI